MVDAGVRPSLSKAHSLHHCKCSLPQRVLGSLKIWNVKCLPQGLEHRGCSHVAVEVLSSVCGYQLLLHVVLIITDQALPRMLTTVVQPVPSALPLPASAQQPELVSSSLLALVHTVLSAPRIFVRSHSSQSFIQMANPSFLMEAFHVLPFPQTKPELLCLCVPNGVRCDLFSWVYWLVTYSLIRLELREGRGQARNLLSGTQPSHGRSQGIQQQINGHLIHSSICSGNTVTTQCAKVYYAQKLAWSSKF